MFLEFYLDFLVKDLGNVGKQCIIYIIDYFKINSELMTVGTGLSDPHLEARGVIGAEDILIDFTHVVYHISLLLH